MFAVINCVFQITGICSYPNRPVYGGFLGSTFFEGNELRFYCREGFDLFGSRTKRCLATGRWSGQRTECKRKANTHNISQRNKIIWLKMGKMDQK